jgi:hypothetical protein
METVWIVLGALFFFGPMILGAAELESWMSWKEITGRVIMGAGVVFLVLGIIGIFAALIVPAGRGW